MTENTNNLFVSALTVAIQACVTDDNPHDKVIAQLAESVDVTPDIVEMVAKGEIDPPADDEIDTWAKILGADAEKLKAAAHTPAKPANAEDKDSNVVPLKQAAARPSALHYATEVTELCVLAGCPDKAAAFIKADTPIEKVRSALLATRAAADGGAVTGQHDDTSGPSANEQWRKVLAKRGVLKKSAQASA